MSSSHWADKGRKGANPGPSTSEAADSNAGKPTLMETANAEPADTSRCVSQGLRVVDMRG